MDSINIVECRGFSKEEAFANLKFDPYCPAIRGTNTTTAWEREGKPIPGTVQFKRFITQQLMEKTKLVAGLGLYIVLEQPIPDTRKRPYSLINNVVRSTREWNLIYQIREDEIVVDSFTVKEVDFDGNLVPGDIKKDISVSKVGSVVGEYNSKAEAIAEAKKLTTITHKNYSIVPIKIPDKTQIAAFVLYSPSSNSKEGTFIAFGVDKD